MAKKDKYNFDAFDNAVKENEYDFDAFDNTLKKKDISGEDSQLDSTIGTQLESPTEDKYGFAKTLDEGRLKLKDKLIETDFPTSNIPEDKLTPIEEEEKPDPELVALLNKNREAYKMGNIENEEIPVMVAHKLGTKGAGIINVDPKELYPEAPQSIPVKGSLDYITRQGAVSSGVGGILTATGTKQTKQDYLQELEDLSKYTPTQLEEKAAFAVSMMIDIPLFAGLGSANGMLLKGAGAQIKNSFIRAGVKKATADKVVTSVVKKYANTLLNSSLKTGLTLAEYDGIKGFSDDIARGKSLDDIDFEERFKGMGKSGITGTMLGAFGANFSFLKNSLSGINSNLSRGLAKAGMVMAEIPAEAGVFSLANAVIKERPISWSNYVDDLMTVGALKVSQLPQMVAKQESKTIPFTKDEVKILGDKVQSTEYFVRNPDKIEGALNNKDIPLSAKSKILYTVTGEKSEKLDVIPDKISVTKEGVVTTKNNAGELIEKRSFSTFEEASDYSLRLQKEVDDYNMNRRVGELPVKDKAKVSDKLNDQGVEEKALTSVLTKSSNDRRK